MSEIIGEDIKFSIIIPVHNKENEIGRCLQSLVSQTYDNFEVIIIDDGSTDGSKDVIKSFLRHKKFRAYFLPQNHGRLVARNTGMRMARNEYICWLDGDDEYVSTYLEVYAKAIKDNPEIKIFNSGMIVMNHDYSGYRIIETVHENDVEGLEKGRIGTGSFVFHNSLRWYFPEDVEVPYGLENSFPAKLVQRDETFKEICKQNNEGHWLPLGNPFGDDFAYFWYITRKQKTKMINAILYIQHLRS